MTERNLLLNLGAQPNDDDGQADDLGGVITPGSSPFADGEVRLLRQVECLGEQLPPAQCGACGCTDTSPCPGGCMWANASATLCSSCALLGGG
jgi:hypothetical protein